ncbi:MAG: DUF721 domain-containing protein [Candidatus Syntrophonatronum acetioxidans]|uniref:DUF721 domain-containing protein n=1 Tax=Candidatus Syntrophonatronum acetioxidans TaxID=1795816 RepID=A0A424YB86_9FIRM|nr:MAG: DUF721 domain-containing protein [Candidatus Syntrophonatronum acetioxidans]
MEKISDSLDKTLHKLGIKKKIKEEMALFHWEEVAGPKISSKTRAEFIKGGILFIKVSSSVWSQQLVFLKKSLIKKLNHRLGERIVQDIYFRVGSWQDLREREEEKEEGWKEEVLKEEEIKAIEESLKGVDDNNIREILRSIIVREAKLDKFRRKKGWVECVTCEALFYPQGEERKCPLCH